MKRKFLAVLLGLTILVLAIIVGLQLKNRAPAIEIPAVDDANLTPIENLETLPSGDEHQSGTAGLPVKTE